MTRTQNYMGSGLAAFSLFIFPLILNLFDHSVDPIFIGVTMRFFIFSISIVFLAGLILRNRIAIITGRMLFYIYPIIITVGALPDGSQNRNDFYDNNYVAYCVMLTGILYAVCIYLLLRNVEKVIAK